MQREKTVKNRIMEIDAAKALGILCVLVGHRTHGFIHTYVYLFHMPLFLILSGCLIKEEKLSFSHKIRKENRLIITYLVYSLIYAVYCALVKQPGLKTLLFNLIDTGTLFGILTLWFLSSLWGLPSWASAF